MKWDGIYRDYTVNQHGSVEDIRTSLKIGSYNRTELEAALRDEESRLKRATVIRMLNTELKKLDKKEATNE